MGAVAIGSAALRLARQWTEVPDIRVFFGEREVIVGKATAFTNSAIECGVIHARALLEFLGLASEGESKLVQRKGPRRADDVGIEQFSGLGKVTPKNAAAAYQGSAAEAEAALAYVSYLANKGLAHGTHSFQVHPGGADLLEIGLYGVPALVIRYFYFPLGLPKPEYEPQELKRVV
jgi:hypothetical protein